MLSDYKHKSFVIAEMAPAAPVVYLARSNNPIAINRVSDYFVNLSTPIFYDHFMIVSTDGADLDTTIKGIITL